MSDKLSAMPQLSGAGSATTNASQGLFSRLFTFSENNAQRQQRATLAREASWAEYQRDARAYGNGWIGMEQRYGFTSA